MMRAGFSHDDDRVLRFGGHRSMTLREWRKILTNRVDDDDVDDDEANSSGDFDDSRTPPTADEYRLLGESADVASILRAYRHELKVERPILMAILRAFRDAEDGVDAVKNDALLAVLGEAHRKDSDLAIMFMEAIERSHPVYLALLRMGGLGWKRRGD
ncbi:hypothetical protein CYMTET_14301 [Cymbomonas tetramitiformis]|uniref:Uncharacterized protein n=1 Tax=Cymbomonas tetramitiformis TaxID=36881 RepID=A0AAE0GGX0_9CHLO|nr:hypothetical protein CYMTET_14301 [Cymbomonas tetramitiformis]